MDKSEINYRVMKDTESQCSQIPELNNTIQLSIKSQYMVTEEEDISQSVADVCNTKFIVSGKRSFEAAKGYIGKKVAVLNFANNHSIGGAPFSAGAQEESLCRCSTLYPCLKAMDREYYKKHQESYRRGELNNLGNDDLIYTPNVIVFKTDLRTDPIVPLKMHEEEWYAVNVITSAAPQFTRKGTIVYPANYESIITSRIKKILDVAAKEQNEVLILGAWGCGAFRNDAKVVSKVFYKLLKNYNFETVEFALCKNGDFSDSEFAQVFREADKINMEKTYNRNFSERNITTLKPNQVFVFGSNINGFHGGGAARTAMDSFGAVWGEGDGMTGQCYAIPTMEGGVDYIKGYVDKFIAFAKQHPEKEFLVTLIACGIAGFSVAQIAPLFADALPVSNILLPKPFVKILIK